MNLSAQALLWCSVQVTFLAAAALGMGTLFGRLRPAAGALVAASALMAIVGLTATAISPWPSWPITWDWLPWKSTTTSSEVPAAGRSDVNAVRRLPTRLAADEAESGLSPSRGSIRAAAETDSFAARSWAVLANNWGLSVALIYLLGIGTMTIRIAWGLIAVHGYRRHSQPLSDPRLFALLDGVCVGLGCRSKVELRQSAALTTPATIGWRRPILLLPEEWPSWTESECRAVLAHEIEHIRRGDFSTWIVAQIGIALHFYHPLVHWLAGRLHLEQELAADAAAARVVGGQRKYLATLAAMALRQSDSHVAWPARAFFPTSRTFLKRIEMLHRSKSLRPDLSRPLFFVTVAAIGLAAVCAAGLRGSAGDDREGAEKAADPQAAFSPEKSGQGRNDLKQIALAMHNYHYVHRHFPPAVVLGPDGKTPHSWRVELLPFLDQQALYDEYRMNEPWDSPANKKILEQMPDVLRSPYDDPQSTNSGYYVLVGPGTVFEGAKGVRIQDITDGTSNTLMVVESKRNVPWTKPEDIPFDPNKPLPAIGGFVKGQFLAALADGSVRQFDNDKAKDQLKWLIMRNDKHPIDWEKFGFLQGRRPFGRRMRFAAVGAAVPEREKAIHSKNNLKSLALAMHNYNDVHRHFPSAVVIGPDGKTPHSWRVELLPFMALESLFRQYRLDEPWDSPDNKKVLAQVPDSFHSPYDDPKSTNSGYYALVGPGTPFGAGLNEITDGTSATILMVEAKRNIPWTKPEDIPFDPDKPLPNLGGFVDKEFGAALCDGSFRRYQPEQIKDQLRWLILRNDGHYITPEVIQGVTAP